MDIEEVAAHSPRKLVKFNLSAIPTPSFSKEAHGN